MNRIRDYFRVIDETATTLQQIRDRLVNQSLLFILVVGLLGIVVSLRREMESGWQPVMTAQVASYFIVLGVFVFRKRVSFYTRAAVLIGLFFLLGIVGLYSFGLTGIAILTFAVVSLLVVVLLGVRPTIISLVVILTTIAIAGIRAVIGIDSYTFDANVYIVSPAAWVLAFVGLITIAGFSIIGVGATQAHLQRMLRQSESRYKMLFNEASDAIVISNLEGVILDANQLICTQLGYSRDELLNMRVGDLVAPQFHEFGMEQFVKLKSLGHVVFETGHMHRNGRIIPVELSVTMIELGEETAVLGIARDITERKQAQAALAASEAQLQTILQTVPVGVGIVQDRALTFANGELGHILGYGAEELIGQNIRILYADDDDFSRAERVWHPILIEEGAASIETRFLRKDGKVIDVFMSSALIDPQDVSAGVISTAINISERKRDEKALSESEERYRSIFEGVSDGILHLDEKVKVLNVNSAFTKITGIPKKDVIGKSALSLAKEFVSTKQLPQIINVIKTGLVNGEHPQYFKLDFHYRTLLIFDGKICTTAITALHYSII